MRRSVEERKRAGQFYTCHAMRADPVGMHFERTASPTRSSVRIVPWRFRDVGGGKFMRGGVHFVNGYLSSVADSVSGSSSKVSPPESFESVQKRGERTG
jgi:hypothetical protein